jgi:diguanylate cyclase (GGDEF)-like protein
VLVVDVDHFKAVNDEHGHAVGDAVLIELVGLVRGLLRAEDLLARIGGEEFAAVLPEIDQAGAERAAQRIRRRVAAREFLDRTEGLRLTVSIGVARCQIEDETPDESLKRADDALYAAKAAGRNRVCVG